MMDDDETFSILCEIEPATTPDLRRVRRQIVAFDGVTDLFLIPDNHIGLGDRVQHRRRPRG